MKKKILLATIGLMTGSALVAGLPINGKSVSGKSGNGKSDTMIELSECIPLSDIAEAYLGNDGYYHITLKDVGNQLDDPENISYAELFAGN